MYIFCYDMETPLRRHMPSRAACVLRACVRACVCACITVCEIIIIMHGSCMYV